MLDHFNQHRRLEHCDYLLNEDGDEGVWAELASLKVFKSASQLSALDFIDVSAGPNGQAKKHALTFDNAEGLKEYLKGAPMKSRTRFM